MQSWLLKGAAVLGLLCGLLEFYLVVAVADEARRGAHAGSAMVYILPFVIILGSAALYFGRLLLGVGAILISLGVQHFMVELTPRFFLPFSLGIAAVMCGAYVLKQGDQVDETPAQPRHHLG